MATKATRSGWARRLQKVVCCSIVVLSLRAQAGSYPGRNEKDPIIVANIPEEDPILAEQRVGAAKEIYLQPFHHYILRVMRVTWTKGGGPQRLPGYIELFKLPVSIELMIHRPNEDIVGRGGVIGLRAVRLAGSRVRKEVDIKGPPRLSFYIELLTPLNFVHVTRAA